MTPGVYKREFNSFAEWQEEQSRACRENGCASFNMPLIMATGAPNPFPAEICGCLCPTGATSEVSVGRLELESAIAMLGRWSVGQIQRDLADAKGETQK